MKRPSEASFLGLKLRRNSSFRNFLFLYCRYSCKFHHFKKHRNFCLILMSFSVTEKGIGHITFPCNLLWRIKFIWACLFDSTLGLQINDSKIIHIYSEVFLRAFQKRNFVELLTAKKIWKGRLSLAFSGLNWDQIAFLGLFSILYCR